MDATLNRLISIDKQARSMVEEAEQYKSEALNSLGPDIEKIKADYVAEAERRIQSILDTEGSISHEADDEMVTRYEGLTKMLEDTYAHKHDELVKQLFNRCIGR